MQLTTNHAGTAKATCCNLPLIKSFLLLSDVTNVTIYYIDCVYRLSSSRNCSSYGFSVIIMSWPTLMLLESLLK